MWWGEVQCLLLLEYLPTYLRALDDGAKLRFVFIPPTRHHCIAYPSSPLAAVPLLGVTDRDQ